jgi:hypothetical protein
LRIENRTPTDILYRFVAVIASGAHRRGDVFLPCLDHRACVRFDYRAGVIARQGILPLERVEAAADR